MFKNLKLIFSPKNKDIRKRIGFTLMGLLIFALGTTIPVPGTGIVVPTANISSPNKVKPILFLISLFLGLKINFRFLNI